MFTLKAQRLEHPACIRRSESDLFTLFLHTATYCTVNDTSNLSGCKFLPFLSEDLVCLREINQSPVWLLGMQIKHHIWPFGRVKQSWVITDKNAVSSKRKRFKQLMSECLSGIQRVGHDFRPKFWWLTSFGSDTVCNTSCCFSSAFSGQRKCKEMSEHFSCSLSTRKDESCESGLWRRPRTWWEEMSLRLKRFWSHNC